MEINIYRDKPEIRKIINSDDCKSEILNLPELNNTYDYITKYSDKVVCVLFSGGYDSTALIIDNLEKGYDVYPIEILFDSDLGRIVRLIILYKLRQKYGDRLHRLVSIADLKGFIDKGEFETRGWNQQPICAFYASFIPKDILRITSEVQIAYVCGDAAISFLDNLTNIYNSTIEFKCYDFKIPPLTFPFKKRTHYDNVDLVNKYDLPCCAGDNTQSANYLYRDLVKSKRYYIELYDDVETQSLNKSGDINKYYFIEIVINKQLPDGGHDWVVPPYEKDENGDLVEIEDEVECPEESAEVVME